MQGVLYGCVSLACTIACTNHGFNVPYGASCTGERPCDTYWVVHDTVSLYHSWCVPRSVYRVCRVLWSVIQPPASQWEASKAVATISDTPVGTCESTECTVVVPYVGCLTGIGTGRGGARDTTHRP